MFLDLIEFCDKALSTSGCLKSAEMRKRTRIT